ncbi:uncharacterized protein CDV56_107516 [Aspergillus thermomutatus]|uniref:FMN hydroxy acid dehydrogenase domain-containing protein n=1 Tax=Aspergillus thermomutatus TaxID=41047 RepID=A0A397GVM2_ASPTH|nr:uncharacterized protein CDV56_107516 [Aspergillus thermomutatus]RHZ54865.1 hypothetical protein CDV56_107516 [Aspergillus thermomutatus]
MTTEILGTKVSLPFGFSPAASQKLAHADGELAASRAAAKYAICMGLSSYSNYSLEDVAAQGTGNPYVMQIAGYKALFLSVDVPVLGKRLNEYHNNYSHPEDMNWPNILSCRADTSNRTDYDPSLDWERTIPWLRKHTSLQIWLKGSTPHSIPHQYERILSHIETAKKEGGKVVIGGGAHVPSGDRNKDGYFVQPTVFTGTTDSMAIVREEVFGPVVIIEPFATEEEAIRRANDTIYGLGAAVFTKDLERAHRVAAEIDSGMVWINSSQDCDPRVPFGGGRGVKPSGIGREIGEAGLAAYSRIKAVHVNKGSRL